jgi:HK97 family phage portal protein
MAPAPCAATPEDLGLGAAPRMATPEDIGVGVFETPKNEADSWAVLRGLFQSAPMVAGSVVSPETSMRVSTVYACVRLIAGAIASLPIPVYRRQENGERERVEHAFAALLNIEPNAVFTAPAFWEFVVGHVLLRGDSVAYLARNRSGEVDSILPFPRQEVVIQQRMTGNPRAPRRLQYLFNTDAGTFGADQDDVLHFTGFGFDGEKSMSVIEFGARTSTGIAISADRHAGEFFSRGAHVEHVVKTAGKMSEAQQEAFRNAWVSKYGGQGVSQYPLLLTEGLDIDQLSMTAKDAQLLESRQWNVVDIARAFGVPPFLVGETTKQTSWGSGIEQLGIGFVVYTLMPHLRRFQVELNRKLFARTDYFCEFNTAGLLRGDNAGRAEYYKAALGGTQNPAWMTADEVRRLENLAARGGEADELSRPEAHSEEPSA